MKESPFSYGKTVSKSEFTNREEELEKLQRNMLQGIHTVIMSPRRWGKSSLVEKSIAEINKKHRSYRTVLIDLFAIGSEKEFLELFAREVLKASAGKWEERIKNARELFRQLIPKITLGTDPFTEFSISFDIKELEKHSDEILNLPELIARKKGIRMVICLDEFQNLATYPGYEQMEKRMRAIWQRQKKVSYCLFGSRRHMLHTIFNDPDKPFYRFGDVINLGKISQARWTKFIAARFTATGKKIQPEAALQIPILMKNHSWYVQQLSHYTWNMTAKVATTDQVESALSEVIRANIPFFQKLIESLSNTQVNMLKAIAAGATQLSSVEVMNNFQLGTPNNITKNRKRLVEEDLVDESGGSLEFSDPVFEIWFRKSFFDRIE